MSDFSPYMIKTFTECPRKFEYKYIKNIMMPQKASNFERGKKIHALANYYLKGADITKLEKALASDEAKIWQTLKTNEFFNKQYVKSEYTLSAKIKNYWVGGRLDALMQDENSYYILDYKTGSIPQNPEFDWQTMIYLYCASKILNTTCIKFVYIDLKNNENKIIEFSKTRQDEYENLLAETLDKMNTVEFSQNPDACRFCEYQKLCLPQI